MNLTSRNPAVWTLSAGILGFATAAVFSALLHWPRAAFVLIYLLLVLCFLVGYSRVAGVNWRTQFQRRWRSGLPGGVLLGVVLARSVLAQPGSPRPQGIGVVWSLAWYGLVYGAVDALLLNILPVLEVYRSRPADKLRDPVYRFRSGLAALAASLLVVGMYHLGFIEFRGASLRQPLLGNAIITAGYLLTGSPITPLAGHITMHIVAVLHGMETTVQIPPHY
jgi:hypothetical protein